MMMKPLAGLLLATFLTGCLQSEPHRTKCDFDKLNKEPAGQTPANAQSKNLKVDQAGGGVGGAYWPGPVMADQVTSANAQAAAKALETELRSATKE